MRLIHLLGAASVHHPVHGEAHAGPDGVFDVPTELGHALLADRANWATEEDHAAAQAAAQLADLADPNKTPHVLLELRNAYTRIDERIRAIEEHLGSLVVSPEQTGQASAPATTSQEPPAPVEQGQAEAGDKPPAKTTKTTRAKKTAAAAPADPAA